MWTVKDLESPRSTQEIALAHVRSNYNHERLIFFSKNQTDGYGTNGRTWVSSDRSLAASMVFPLNFNMAHNAPKLLPLIFALLIARILEKAPSTSNLFSRLENYIVFVFIFSFKMTGSTNARNSSPNYKNISLQIYFQSNLELLQD